MIRFIWFCLIYKVFRGINVIAINIYRLTMIELGKKYKLKKIKGFDSFDNEYYKVIGFYNFDTVICENTYGERFIFMKEFLIDPQKPEDIYSNLRLERKK